MKTAIAILLCLSLTPAYAVPKRFFKVDDNLYRGRQPGPADYADLAKMGIKTILDLRGGSIHKPHERREAQSAGLNYVSVRLSGIWEPHDSQMAEILNLLNDSSKGPFYVHCHRGADRVGMVVACYRMAHDHWTNQQALAEARKEGLNPLEYLMRRYLQHFNAEALHLHGPATVAADHNR